MKNSPRIFGIVAIFCAFVTLAVPQQNKAKQLYVVTYVDVFPNFADETAKMLHQFAIDSRKDPGSVRMEILRDTTRTNHFSIIEVWADQKSFEAHLALPHSKQFREKLQAGLGSPFDERLYNQEN